MNPRCLNMKFSPLGKYFLLFNVLCCATYTVYNCNVHVKDTRTTLKLQTKFCVVLLCVASLMGAMYKAEGLKFRHSERTTCCFVHTKG